jgi:hypothetical protein
VTVSPPRWPLATGAIAATQMTVVAGLDGATRAGYDPYRNWVSQLALGPHGWVGVANFALCAAWLTAFGAALHHHLPPSRPAGWAVRLVLLCGAGFAVVALVPIDPGLDYPPGTTAVHTLAGYVHQAGALVLFAAGTGAAVLLGVCLREVCRAAAWLGAAAAAVMVVSFVAASVLVTLDITGTLPGTPSGLLERIALATGLSWLAAAGLCLIRPRGDRAA